MRAALVALAHVVSDLQLRTLEVRPDGQIDEDTAREVGREQRHITAQDRATITPIEWLHFPKTGSSFQTTLAHFACGSKLAANATVQECFWGPAGHELPRAADGALLHADKPNSPWGGGDLAWRTSDWNAVCGDQFASFESGHEPLREEASLEHTVAMFRDPKTRIMSGYHARMHDCRSMQVDYCTRRDGVSLKDTRKPPDDCVTSGPQAAPVEEYSRCVGGCMGNMLMGEPCSSGGGVTAPTHSSIARVPHLGFVGLTEEFDLSVCLWHARFGGECLPSEFEHLRKGPVQEYDTSKVGTPSDWYVYEAAKKVFWDDVERFGVSRATCHDQICTNPETQKYFALEPSALAEGVASDYDWPGRYRYVD